MFFARNCSQFAQIKRLILKETKISKNHLTPEISLHLITPECPLYTAPILADNAKIFENDPFWGFYWPGGQALSRYILDHPTVIAGKSLLDVGAGCGASSLASILCAAKYVIANDIDAVAGCATMLNADLNGIPTSVDKIRICNDNLIGSAVDQQIILIGDLFYDEDFADILLPWLQRLRNEGKEVLIGDPGRQGLSAKRINLLQKLSTYELSENCCIENNGFKIANVWRMK